MNDLNPFEKQIRRTYRLPDIDPAFFDRLETRLQTRRSNPDGRTRQTFHLRWTWAFFFAVLLMVGALVFAVGPSKVLAQIQAIFGFVPGVGLVDTRSSFRQLVQPVSDTREGITLQIQSAFLSAERSVVTYTMTELPSEIKRTRFGDAECLASYSLVLPNGDTIESSGSRGGLLPGGSFVHQIDFDVPLPMQFNQAVLVFPCLEGAARGKGPQDWRINLNFEPASQDIEVFPAAIFLPEARAEKATLPAEVKTTDSAMQPNPPADTKTTASAMPAMIVDGVRREEMAVLSVVEKPDSVWVTWAYPDKFDADIRDNGQLYLVPFNPVLYDAYGKKLPEPDHDTQIELWKYEDSLREHLSEPDGLKYSATMHTFVIPKSGVSYPVYIKQNVYERSFPEKEANAEVEFDGGKVQTSDDPVKINREIKVGSVQFELKAIRQNPYGGYSFLFDGSKGKVVQCRVELVDHPANMSGEGSFTPDDPFHFYQAVMYPQAPTGILTVRVSQPAVLGDLVSLIGSWAPEK